MASTATIEGVGQMLFWMCGQFQLQARNLSGGGSVTPYPPITPMPNPVEFVVTDTTIIPKGVSSATFPQFIGYNVTFDRGGQPQTQLSSQPTYFSWNKVTGLFQCFPAADTDELFSINPV